MNSLLHRIDESLITEDLFLACVEITKGSKNKYEYNEDMDSLILDRILFTSTHYPHNYGFIPKTWGLDDDPLDVMIISSEPIVPLALVKCKPIGVLEMLDGGLHDEKIIAVPISDPFFSSYDDLVELPGHVIDEIKHFFKVYKQLEFGKSTNVEGFKSREKARQIIRNAKDRYHQKFEGGK